MHEMLIVGALHAPLLAFVLLVLRGHVREMRLCDEEIAKCEQSREDFDCAMRSRELQRWNRRRT